MGNYKPAALKLLGGTAPGRDSGGQKVKLPPPFKRVAPEAPDWLTEDALTEWERVIPELMRLELLKELDQQALAAYCECVSMFKRCVQNIEEEGLHIQVNEDKVIANSAVSNMLKFSQQLRGWANEFGLTPSAENRLATVEPKPKDDDSNPF
jgi:P27 family predicted phage terminase small subunit